MLMTGISYLLAKWHLIPKVFIYLFHFPSPYLCMVGGHFEDLILYQIKTYFFLNHFFTSKVVISPRCKGFLRLKEDEKK